MYDASVKSPVGVEYGVEYQFGNFDQCMEVTADLKNAEVNIQSKYCLVDVELKGYKVRQTAARHQKNVSCVIKVNRVNCEFLEFRKTTKKPSKQICNIVT